MYVCISSILTTEKENIISCRNRNDGKVTCFPAAFLVVKQSLENVIVAIVSIMKYKVLARNKKCINDIFTIWRKIYQIDPTFQVSNPLCISLGITNFNSRKKLM